MLKVSVVIPTYNRPVLLRRAIRSVLNNADAAISFEIIVIDDCSLEQPDLSGFSPYNIIYKKLSRNSGPQQARNEGIALATGDWVIMLDDDDEFLKQTVAAAFVCIHKLPGKAKYPVFFFATSNGSIPQEYRLIGAKEIMNGTLKGDFTPVIRRKLFIRHRLQYLDYPEILGVGCEHLTWLQISSRFSIPAFRLPLVKVNTDAPFRLSSYRNFMKNSLKFALQQDISIEFVKQYKIDKLHAAYVSKKYLGAAIYYLVSGKKRTSIERLRVVRKERPLVGGIINILLSLPVTMSRIFLRLYKMGFNR